MAACASCGERLVFANIDGVEVPDDLQLPCGCHFHWECLFENAAQIVVSLQCPNCGQAIAVTGQAGGSSSAASSATTGAQILTEYTNESGLQSAFDIYPRLAEEAFYETRPTLLPARAFLTMCSEGDVDGILALYVEAESGDTDGDDGGDDDDDNMEDRMDDDDAPPASPMCGAELLRYQDPLNGMESGLHVAIVNGQPHVAYLLLYLASRLPAEQFPPELQHFAAIISRPEPALVAHPDIRTLQTALGETVETYALRKGGPWADLAQAGLFSA